MILAPFRLMGTQFSRGLPKGGEAVQVVRQVFQAELDFRAAVAFRENLSALVCQFAHQPEHVSTRLRTRDLRRLRDFCFGVRGWLRQPFSQM